MTSIKLTFVFIISLLQLNLFAKDYFVSNSSGNDNNPGTYEKPWKSFSKVNSYTFKYGDKILLKTGDKWNESLAINKNGITVDSYGNDKKPIISGLTEVLNFTRTGENLYSSPINKSAIYMFIYNGNIFEKGRYPENVDEFFPENVTSTSISDSHLENRNFEGAELVVRNNQWKISVNQITEHKNNTIVAVPTVKHYPFSPHGWYFIQNDPSLLNSNGEWAFRDNRLFVYSEADISKSSIFVSMIDTLVNITADNISIRNIDIRGAGIDAINYDSENISISSCDIGYCGRAVRGRTMKNSLTVENCSIRNCTGDGITTLITKLPLDYTITGNTIDSIGLWYGLAMNSFDESHNAITSGTRVALNLPSGGNRKVHHNSISNIGYYGIGGGNDVQFNHLNNICLLLYDGGGFYTFNSDLDTANAHPGIVKHNIIENCGGPAIYLDERTNNHIVDSNTVINSKVGIIASDIRECKIRGNILFNNQKNLQILNFVDSTHYPDYNVIENNISYSEEPNTYFQYDLGPGTFTSFNRNSVGFGKMDDNYILYKEKRTINSVNFNYYSPGFRNKSLTIKELQNLDYDKNSTVLYNSAELFYNPTNKDSVFFFEGYRYDVYGNKHYDKVELESFESILLLDGTQTFMNSTYLDGLIRTGISLKGGLNSSDIVKYEFSAMVEDIIEHDVCLLMDDGQTSTISVFLNSSNKILVGVRTTSGYQVLSDQNLELSLNEPFNIKVAVDKTERTIVATTDKGSFSKSFKGDLLEEDDLIYIGYKSLYSSYYHFKGYIWDIRINNEIRIPYPHLGFGYRYVNDGYVPIQLSLNGGVSGRNISAGSNYISNFGYIDRLGEYIPNMPNCMPTEELNKIDVFHKGNNCNNNFYVSNIGNDDNSGSSPDDPWKSISKINSIDFLPGSVIHFKCHDIWNGSINISSSGTEDAPIVLKSYGIGAKPIINGRNSIKGWSDESTWTLVANNVYKKEVKNAVRRLWLDDDERKKGTSLVLNDESPWIWQNDTLYIYSLSNPAHSFTSIQRGDASFFTLSITESENVIVQDLNLRGGNMSTLIKNSSNITVEDCKIGENTNAYGLYIYATDKNTICDNIKISNNIFDSKDRLKYNYDKELSTYDGIFIGNGVANLSVSDNYLLDWSRTGIQLSASNTDYSCFNIQIENNIITAPHIDYSRGVSLNVHGRSTGTVFSNNTISSFSKPNEFNGNNIKINNNIFEKLIAPDYQSELHAAVIIGSSYDTEKIKIYNNIIRGNSDFGLVFNPYQKNISISGLSFRNNVLSNNNKTDYSQIYIPEGAKFNNNIFRNNLYYSNYTTRTIKYGSAIESSESISEGELLDVSGMNNNLIINGESTFFGASGGREIELTNFKIKY